MPGFARGFPQRFRRSLVVVVALLAGCATVSSFVHSSSVKLSGEQEVPPVKTTATGKGEITVMSDQTVSGSITISGVAATAAHIHLGAAGKNGPVIIPLNRTSGDTFTVPANTKLTDAQFKAYKADELYVNVHSAAHKGGEIRGQISATLF